MEKVSRTVISFALVVAMLCTAAFAAYARWQNVASLSPSISANDDVYSCEVSGLSGTTKIYCSLTLYEKGWFGTYTKVASTSSTYYGSPHVFSGTCDIQSGKTYRLDISATVTRNGSAETVSDSFEKKC